jgi:hypothetical protein
VAIDVRRIIKEVTIVKFSRPFGPVDALKNFLMIPPGLIMEKLDNLSIGQVECQTNWNFIAECYTGGEFPSQNQ